MGSPLVALDEATYFINVAVIAGALIGLTFIALNLFMVDMLTRFEGSAFPVFRKRENEKLGFHPRRRGTPAALTDKELLDGDPLVVFMAFSVAVSWSLFLLPLVIGLTAAWNKRFGLLAVEMFVFSLILFGNFRVRAKKVKQLNPYLTREERWWPLMSGAAFVLYVSTLLALVFARFPAEVPHMVGPSSSIWFGFSYEDAATFLLKFSCIASLVLGTYTVNKDMFIFFKSSSAERMRHCWLKEFVANIYPGLATRMEALEAKMAPESFERSHLRRKWVYGPKSLSSHDSFRNGDSAAARGLWSALISSCPKGESAIARTPEQELSVPVWLLDIPAIARWADEVERDLERAESA